ncbi:glycosyltransferase family 4 protein [Pseudoalteromonas sp. XMcav11-Q]
MSGVDTFTYVSQKRREPTLRTKKDLLVINNQTIFCKYFYTLKVITVLSGIRKVKAKESLVHAHTLYSDGIPAYLYSIFNKKQLVITIRTTDIMLGFKYYRQHKWLARKALRYAKKIIFISPSHLERFISYFGNEFNSKVMVIPNGIDDFYLNNTQEYRKKKQSAIIGLYIGRVDRNKNVDSSITSFFRATKGKNSRFRVVGGTYEDYVKVYGPLAGEIVGRVEFLGELRKEEVLKQMRDSSLLIMVSHSETFGLVYIEALSQCLPIVYTSGQGIDGYFKDGEYGFKANSSSVESISKAIKNTLHKFPNGLGPFEENPAVSFSWDRIAKVYMEEVY